MAPGVFHPRLPRYGRLTHEQERLGVTGSLQCKVSDDTTLHWTCSMRASTRRARRTSSRRSRSAAPPRRAASRRPRSSRPKMTRAATGLRRVQRRRHPLRIALRRARTKFTQFTLDLDQHVQRPLSLNAKIGRADSEFRNPVQTTVTLDAPNVNGYSFDFRDDDRTPRSPIRSTSTAPARGSGSARLPRTARPRRSASVRRAPTTPSTRRSSTWALSPTNTSPSRAA